MAIMISFFRCIKRCVRGVLGLAVFVCVAAIALPVFAAQYNGQPFSYQQPDGSEITVYVFGDEFLAYGETEDGYIVTKDPKSGYFCYAKLKPDGSEIISTGVRVGRAKPPGLKPKIRYPRAVANAKHAERRAMLRFSDSGRLLTREELEQEMVQRASSEEGGETTEDPPIVMAPPASQTVGKRVSLVLLASFPDRPGDINRTQAEIDAFSNEDNYTAGGNAASIRGYFLKQSNNRLDYSSIVAAWFTAANPRSYYTEDRADISSLGPQARELITEGLQVLKDDGFDFTQCDGDGDGDLDGINMFYAGDVVNAWADNFGLWPHSSSGTWSPLSGTGLTSAWSKYQVTALSSSLLIGTWIHENGHMICLYPDLYSYNGNAANVGQYSLMGSGNYAGGQKHPTSIDSYLKYHSGWMDVVELDSTTHQRCVVQVDGNRLYRYRNPSEPLEYFTFEVRDNTGYEGPYGGHLAAVNPDTGLLIWHNKENGSSTHGTIVTGANPVDYTTPYEAMVIEAAPATASSPWYTDPTPNGNDALKSSGVSSFTDSTTPTLKFWDATGRNTSDGVDIHSVSADGAVMTFVVGAGAPSGAAAVELSRSTMKALANYGSNAESQTFAICNAQGGTLNYNVSDNAAWLSCDVASGAATTEADLVTVSFQTDALSPGTYNGTITVDDGGASSKTITVDLTVYEQPTLAVNTTNLTSIGTAGSAGPDVAFELSNPGGGTASYTLGKTASWLTLSHTTGTVGAEVDFVTLSPDATSLAAGTYNDTVTISSADATNAPLTVSIEYTVQSTDMIVTSPDGGEFVYGATTQTLTWASSLGGNVRIDLLKGGTVDQTLVATTPNDGSYDWVIPSQVGGTDYRIRITSIEQSSKSDDSNGDFSIYPVGGTVMGFETDLDGWTQDNTDDLDWTRQTGGTASASTGPTAAQEGLYYIYIESSTSGVGFPDKTSIIYKDYDFSTINAPVMAFQYHMYGASMGTLYLEVSPNGGSSWDMAVWSLAGDQGNAWQPAIVDLSAYAGNANVRIRFRGVTGSNYFSDMSLDAISIVETATDGVKFANSSYTITEAGGTATITVERSGSTSGAISVDYTTSNGTAVASSDYTTTSGTLSWADGNGDAKTFDVTITDDTTKETFEETVSLVLSNPSGTTIIGANPATLVIQDDDNQAPVVNAGSDQTIVLAGATWSPLDVGVDLWLDADDAATVQLNGGTVSNWVDKSGFGRDASQTSASSQPTDTAAGLNGKHVLTFDGSSDFFNVDLDFLAGVPHSAFVVTKVASANNIYGAANGSAGANSLHVGFAGSNYRMNYWANDFGPARSANFQSGAANLVNYVWNTGVGKEIFANGSSEGSNINAGDIGTMSGGGRISNITGHGYYGGDIAEIIMKTGTVSQVDRELFEGYLSHKWGIESYLPGGHTYATNSPSGAEASANLSGTATDGDDDPLTLTWTMTSGPAPVSFDDNSISNAVATFSKAGEYTLRLTANDGIDPTFDECVITVITGGVSVVVTESDGSTDIAEGGSSDTYDLSLLIAPTNDVVVDLSTDGQVNVSPTSVTFTTVNWTNAHTITVTAIDDGTDEGAHTGLITHVVSSLDTAYDGLSVSDVIPNITDNDAPGVIGLSSATYNVSEDGTNLTVYLTRTGGDAGVQSVDITTLDGTAIAGTDYTTNSTTLSWSDRDSSAKPFTISILNNSTFTGDRAFAVELRNLSGGATFGTTSATITITEDDPEPIGARVITQSPDAAVSQSPGVTQVTLTFSEAIDTSSFNPAEDIISFTGSQGTNLLSTITGHSWANGDTELTITFNALMEGASHRLVIGPDILTATGFPMDQDNDSILGEGPEDSYAANIWIVSGGTGVTLWSDLVNPDDTADPGWILGTGWEIGTPAEGVSSDGGANVIAQSLAGNYDDTSVYDSYAETPDIDGANFTSLLLDFQTWKGIGKSDTIYLDVVNSSSTNRLYSSVGPNGGANDAGWNATNLNVSAYATGQVFRIRWGIENVISPGGAETGWQLDAIKLSGDSTVGGDPALPMVVSHAPTGTIEGLVSSLYLSFSQPMDTNSFAIVDDVASFAGPSGSITATGSVWVSSSLLRIDFAEQVASGLYTLVLEPTLQDAWAQFIDQNANGTGNEGAVDRYSASFTLDNANYIPAPSGLNATAVSSSQVDVYWTDNSTNATGFVLERSTTSGSGFASIANPTATNYSDVTVSTGVTYYYRVFATNGTNSSAISDETFVAVPKAPATITVSDLAQTYDGGAKPVAVMTSPTGLTVNVTYEGNSAAPTNAGSYNVYAIISDTTYQGETNETLVISKATASVSFSGLSQTYSGAARTVGASTTPGGLTVDITYDGSPSAPINAGSYAITGTVNDVNYQGQNTDTLVVSKLTPTVTNWPTASDIMDGEALSDSSLTGGGATVPGSFSFDAPATTPGIGTYIADVTFTPTDATNYESVSGTVDVAVKAAAIVTLSNLSQTYDGTAKTVSVHTTPTGLVVDVTYALSPVAPTNAGNYTIEATVNDADYIGSTNGMLVVSKATPTVDTWPSAADIYVGQSLADATLSGGSASVTGLVTYDAPGTTPPEGTYSAAVIFTPDDSTNYNTVSGTVDVTVLPLAPATPTGLTAVPGIGEVDLHWNASATATSYNVKRATISGGPYSTVGSPATTNMTDSVANGATYYYVVSAVNAGGESSNAPEVSAKLLHVVPFVENFEGLSTGLLNGQNAWVSSNTVVQTNVAFDAQAGSITQEIGFVEQEFAGASSNVWTDFEIQPVFCAEPPAIEGNADSTTMLYFNTNGNPVVYNGTNLQTLSSITLTNGAWIRVSVRSDYANKKWDLYINSTSAATGLDFYNASVTRYEKLRVSGAGPSGATIDNLSVNENSPFGDMFLLTVTSLYGSPTPSGSGLFTSNTIVNASLSGSPITMGSTQYVCTGWARVGSEAGNGTATNTRFTITEDTTLNWQWTTNYWIDLSTIGE